MDILIVDDHPVVAEGLKKLLSDSGITTKCLVSYSVKECLDVLNFFVPSLILLDINLPDGSGVDLCKIITAKYPEIRIIALTSFSQRSYITRMMDNGASGYLLKNSSEEEILTALKEVESGKKFYGFEVSEILKTEPGINNNLLTRREIEVLNLIANGYTNQEIAEKAFISAHTVDSHRKNLLLKIGAKNTAELVKIAIQKGLITGDW